MATLDSGPAPSFRIEQTVERELARRRRLLSLYVFLLLVPLGLAAWFLFSAASEVTPQEAYDRLDEVEQRYAEIAPKLDQVESLDEALPVVQQAAEQLQAQKRQVGTLQQQVQAVSSDVQEIAPVVREIQANQVSIMRNLEPSAEVKELSSRVETVERSLDGVQQLSAQLERQEQRLAGIEKQQREVVRDLREIEAKVEGQPAALDPQVIQKLLERVRALEEGTGTLRKDLTRIRADILERKPPG